jgi:serine/threonine protein phosphatase 1
MKSADGAQGGRFVVEGRIRVARYATNTRGRDFVVGDLHGCRALLDRLLREVNFRPESDRLFSVGDLIDRGPESMSCLDLLDEPWCHGVLGNHEVMLIDFFSRALALGGRVVWEEEHDFLRNGGGWVRRELVEGGARVGPRLMEVLNQLETLPHLIVVGSGPERFHVVHAELLRPSGASPPVYLDEDIDRGFAHLEVNEQGRLIEVVSWSRHLMGRGGNTALPETVEGLSTTYCGHTPGFDLRRVASHVCIDTGAYLPYLFAEERGHGWGLTLVEPRTGAVYKAEP